MYRGIVIFLGIIGAIISVVMGVYSLVTWEIVAVLVAVSLGIPSLILTYEKVKPEEIVAQRKAEPQHEKETIKLPTPSRALGKRQKSALLQENAKITELNVDNSLLDEIYEQAHRKAVDIYRDAQLSEFTVQIYPFAEIGGKINIYLSFYSEWADKICQFRYREDFPEVVHAPPNKSPKFESDRRVFTTLPWKKSPQWMELLDRIYAKIGPFAPAIGTNYHIFAFTNQKTYWRFSFSDNFSGNEYEFEWNGKDLDKKSIKEL